MKEEKGKITGNNIATMVLVAAFAWLIIEAAVTGNIQQKTPDKAIEKEKEEAKEPKEADAQAETTDGVFGGKHVFTVGNVDVEVPEMDDMGCKSTLFYHSRDYAKQIGYSDSCIEVGNETAIEGWKASNDINTEDCTTQIESIEIGGKPGFAAVRTYAGGAKEYDILQDAGQKRYVAIFFTNRGEDMGMDEILEQYAIKE